MLARENQSCLNKAGPVILVFAFFAALAPKAECAHGDSDGDRDVDFADFAAFQTCFSGPGAEPADPDCLPAFDFNTDGSSESCSTLRRLGRAVSPRASGAGS